MAATSPTHACTTCWWTRRRCRSRLRRPGGGGRDLVLGPPVRLTPEQLHERRWWTLGVLCLSLLVIGVDNTILNVALPSIVRSLHAQGSQLQWIIDAYTLVFAGLLLTAGSLGDRLGRKGALTAGLVLFGGFSALAS